VCIELNKDCPGPHGHGLEFLDEEPGKCLCAFYMNYMNFAQTSRERLLNVSMIILYLKLHSPGW